MSEAKAADMPLSLGRRLACEMLGTGALLAAVVGSGIMAERLSGGNDGLALLANAIATGAILHVLITMLGPLSGAHFNPAVSLVMALRREISAREAAFYAIAQVVGGILGVILAHAMFDSTLVQTSSHVRAGTGLAIAEIVASFGLVATILLTRRVRPDGVALAVALYITSAYWFTASTSFANPAATIARSFTDSFAGIAPSGIPVFIACQLAGAVLAAFAVSWLLGRNTLDRAA